MRTKELGQVAPEVAKLDPARASMLQAICGRVVATNPKTKTLGCAECVDCDPDGTVDGSASTTTLVDALPGSFTRSGAEQAFVVTSAATLDAYMHRYFLLEKREGRFWVQNLFEYYGRPYDMRLLKTGAGTHLIAMMIATPGTPPPSALEVFRFSDKAPQHTTLVPFSRGFLTCSPSEYQLAEYAVRDKDGDKDDDIAVKIDDFAPELQKTAVEQRLSKACEEGRNFRPTPKRLTFEFVFVGDHFETSDAAASRLSLDGKELAWSSEDWEL